MNVETGTHERHLEQLINADVPMTKLDAAGDHRIIPGGRFLRATGLDELTQLFNVLRGEMSLVGPRPCIPHEFKSYQVWQRERVSAQPVLTGFWQVNGKNRTTFTEMIKSRLFSLAGNKSIMSGMPRRTPRYWSTLQKHETSILKGIFTLAPDLHANRDFVASGYHSCGEHR